VSLDENSRIPYQCDATFCIAWHFSR